MTSAQPLAFIYDRQASPTPGVVVLHLEVCNLRARDEGWQIAGEWVDKGDAALSDDNRPEFDTMMTSMAAAVSAGREVLCLVADWGRLSRDFSAEAALRARVRAVGGYTATGIGEDDRAGSTRAAPSAL